MTKKELRVLMLSWEYPPHVTGGLGAHVAALAPALVRAGVQVHLVTPRWRGGELQEQLANGIRTSRTKTLPPSVYRVNPPVMMMGNFYADAQQTNLNLQDQSEKLFAEVGGFDLIHAHDWLVAFAGASLKRIHKTPLLATIHATERGRGRGFLGDGTARAINGAEWWLTYEAWRVITCSQFMADEVRDYFSLPLDKIEIVPNGVDAAPFDALDGAELSEFRARWALPEEQIVFNVGRLVEEKGAHLIVEAAPRVLSQMPNTRFVIAGMGGLVDYCKRRAWELGVADKVLIAGYLSDPDRNRLLKVANVAVFPSLYEPFGIVALEAMAAKCPVVVSQVGGLSEVLRHTETGVTVHPGSVESLAWGILHTLSDPNRSKDRATKAYRVVKEQYNWDYIASQTIEVYDHLVHERAKVDW